MMDTALDVASLCSPQPEQPYMVALGMYINESSGTGKEALASLINIGSMG